MTFLLDTHVLLWALSTPNRLPDGMRTAILDPTSTVMASAVNIAEIAIKSSIGKLDIGSGLEADNYAGLIAAVEDAGFGMLPLTAAHAGHLRALPFHHRDPFDRMIIAQALAEDIAVASVDETFTRYSVKLVP